MNARAIIATACFVATSAWAHHPHDVATLVELSPVYDQDLTAFTAVQGTFDMLLRSTDGGETWAPSHTGMRGRQVTALQFSPDFANDRTIYLGTGRQGVDVSTDGGTNWQRTSISTTRVLAIGLSPDFANDGIMIVGSQSGIRWSDNGGATNQKVIPAGVWPVLRNVTFSSNFTTDGTVYAAADTIGVIRSTDRGLTWDVLPTGIEPIPVRDILVGLDDPNLLVVATIGAGIIRSLDGGDTWEPFDGGMLPVNIHATALEQSPDFTNDATIYATTADEGVLRSTDRGRTWRSEPFPYVPLTHQTQEHWTDIQLPPNYGDSGEAWVAMFEGVRIRKSRDPDDWASPRILPTRLGRRVKIAPEFDIDPTILATGYGFEVLYSEDGGHTWDIRNQGSASVSNYALSLSPNFAEDHTFMSGTGWGIERSTDRGLSWQWRPFIEGLSGTPSNSNDLGATKAIGFSPGWESDSTVFAGNWWTVQKSTDGGKAWGRVLDLHNRCYDLAVSPGFVSDREVWVVTPTGPIMTEDAGATWTERYGNLLGTGYRKIELSPTYPDDGTVFVTHTNRGIVRSRDRGESWEDLAEAMPDPNINELCVVGSFDTPGTGTMIAGTSAAGVIVSTDGGDTWESRWPTSLEGGFIESLSVSKQFEEDGTMIAGCYGGFYMTWDGGSSWTRVTTVERYDDRREDTGLWSPTEIVPLVIGPPGTNRDKVPSAREWHHPWLATLHPLFAEGYASIGTVPGARVQFDFNGIGVHWIGVRSPLCGRAAWSLDGGEPDTLDLYSPVEEFAVDVLQLDGLTEGPHSLTIEVLGEGEGPNWDQMVVVDAFDVIYGEQETYFTE